MRMSYNNLNTIATAADVVNTLGGGISEPQIVVYESTDSHRLEVKVPGVKSNTLSVEVNGNWLNLFHVMEMQILGSIAPIPRVIFHKPIPYFIDVDRISAFCDEDKLQIMLPFKKGAIGYQRKIEIRNG